MVDLADLTPATSDALARLKAQLAAQGYDFGDPISGFRTYEDQRQLYANYLAGRAGRPLPYPERGPVALAATPGHSPHEFGVAFDTGLHGAALDAANRIAPGLGLSTVAGDPGHFQLATWAPGASAPSGASESYADVAPPARPASLDAVNTQGANLNPGTTLNSSPAAPWYSGGPMGLTRQLETGDRNIMQEINDKNMAAGTPGTGYYQMIDPTFQRFGGVGSAIGSSLEDQSKIAAAIPIKEWGPRTVAGIQAAYPGIDVNMTLGQAQAQYGNGAAPGAPATGGSGPIDPSIIARGGYSPPIPDPTPAPSIAGGLAKGLTGLAKAIGGDDKKDAQQQEQKDEKPQMPPPPPARNVSPLLPMSSQLASLSLGAAGQPMQWGGGAPGRNFWANMGPQVLPGMTLNSLAQMQAQMGLIDPYGGYGYGA